MTRKSNKQNSSKKTPSNGNDRKYSVILYGATGYTGELIAFYLLENYGFNQSDSNFQWAIAGRNKTKLEILKSRLEKAAQKLYPENSADHDKKAKDLLGGIDIVVVDADDEPQIQQMVRQTRVLIATVGPYLKYGIPVVKACVENKTDYLDLAGEIPFIRQSIDKFHEKAAENGVRIVHACGFDALPSDIGVMSLQDAVIARTNNPADEILAVVLQASGGGISAGTAASISNLYEWVGEDPDRKKLLADPYALNDKKEGLPKQPDCGCSRYDTITQRWLAPFLMGVFNTRIVRRSNELMRYRYGRDFRYTETMVAPSILPKKLLRQRRHLGPVSNFLTPISHVMNRVSAEVTSLGVGGLTRLMSYAPTRDVLRNLLKYLARNPSKEARQAGRLKMIFSARRNGKEIARTLVTSNRDPGYGGTAVMIAEAALALDQDRDKLRSSGGVLTPAAGLGEMLRVRLEATGIFNFETVFVDEMNDDNR